MMASLSCAESLRERRQWAWGADGWQGCGRGERWSYPVPGKLWADSAESSLMMSSRAAMVAGCLASKGLL